MFSATHADWIAIVGGKHEAGPIEGEVRGVCTDSREVQPGNLFVPIVGERFDGHDFIEAAIEAGAGGVLTCRDVQIADPPVPIVWVADTVDALHKLAAHHRARLAGEVITITGACGKTTTKNLLHHVLAGTLTGSASRASYNNHLGVPLTLLAADATHAYVIVEIGTNHPGEVAPLAALAQPTIAVVTGVVESHLEGLGDIVGVADEELSQLAHRRPGGLAVVNIDHPLLKQAVADLESPVITFGFAPAADVSINAVAVRDDQLSVTFNVGYWEGRGIFDDAFSRLPMLGRHNASNLAAVRTVAASLGVPDAVVAERLATFEAPSRRHVLRRLASLKLLDDTYNANPGSMSAAIQSLADLQPGDEGRRVLVMGDMLELGDAAEAFHYRAGEEAGHQMVDLLVIVGDWTETVAHGYRTARGPGDVVTFATADEAAEAVPAMLRAGDAVVVKASRGVRLDKVSDAIVAAYANEPPPPGEPLPPMV